MSREVRRVPASWEHPKHDDSDHYQPLFPGEMYKSAVENFMGRLAAEGLQSAIEWCGRPPDRNEYMPNWPGVERTDWMMYETVSEGTPISPAFATPEELARWLADTKASAGAYATATYNQWLNMILRGSAPSMVMMTAKDKSLWGKGCFECLECEAKLPWRERPVPGQLGEWGVREIYCEECGHIPQSGIEERVGRKKE